MIKLVWNDINICLPNIGFDIDRPKPLTGWSPTNSTSIAGKRPKKKFPNNQYITDSMVIVTKFVYNEINIQDTLVSNKAIESIVCFDMKLQ